MPASAHTPTDWSAPLPRVVHGTAVAVSGRAVLIVGPSGAGKSSLALQLMALGAGLVSDDLTRLSHDRSGGLQVSSPAPPGAPFAIEARGVGLLAARPAGPAVLCALVDLAEPETERLPDPRSTRVAGCPVPTIRRVEAPAFPAMVFQLLRAGFSPAGPLSEDAGQDV